MQQTNKNKVGYLFEETELADIQKLLASACIPFIPFLTPILIFLSGMYIISLYIIFSHYSQIPSSLVH